MIELKIRRIQLRADDLTRLGSVLSSDFKELKPNGSVLHSGDLTLMVTVEPELPTDALTTALRAIDSAFDKAELDQDRRSEIAGVTMKPARSAGTSWA